MAFWVGAVAGLVASPVIVSGVLELKMVDATRCTMGADLCARLTKQGTP
jgi:hypothetical protein